MDYYLNNTDIEYLKTEPFNKKDLVYIKFVNLFYPYKTIKMPVEKEKIVIFIKENTPSNILEVYKKDKLVFINVVSKIFKDFCKNYGLKREKELYKSFCKLYAETILKNNT